VSQLMSLCEKKNFVGYSLKYDLGPKRELVLSERKRVWFGLAKSTRENVISGR